MGMKLVNKSILKGRFKICIDNGVFWFRLFGYGLCFQSNEKCTELFSTRNKIKKCFYLGFNTNLWRITFLNKF